VSFEELSKELKKSTLIGQILKENTYVVKSDPIFTMRPFPKVEGLCSESAVKSVIPVNFDQDFMLEVQTNGSCPIVVSTTFVSDFKAIVVGGNLKDTELQVYPANGSLVGILVPPQVNKILLKMELDVPLWCKVIYFFSFIMFFGILIFVRKKIF
jgi:hypothetical protein